MDRRLALLLGALALTGGCLPGASPPPPPPASTESLSVAAPPPTGVPTPTASAPTPVPTEVPRALAPPPTPPNPTATPVEVRVEVDEATVNERLNADLPDQLRLETPFGPATPRNLAVRLDGGEVVLSGEVLTGFFSLPLSVTTTVDARGGRPLASVREASVGGMLVPESARQQLEQTVQAAVDQAVAREGLYVETVVIDGGRLTLRGRGN